MVKFLLLNIDEFEGFTVRVVEKEGYFFMLTHLDHGGIYLVFARKFCGQVFTIKY